jgi:hypothetical protein
MIFLFGFGYGFLVAVVLAIVWGKLVRGMTP